MEFESFAHDELRGRLVECPRVHGSNAGNYSPDAKIIEARFNYVHNRPQLFGAL